MKDMELLHKLEDIVTEELKRVAKKGDVQPAESRLRYRQNAFRTGYG